MKTRLNFKAYNIIARAIEEGIEIGWNRAHKHINKPEPDSIKSHIYEEVLNSLSEVVKL